MNRHPRLAAWVVLALAVSVSASPTHADGVGASSAQVAPLEPPGTLRPLSAADPALANRSLDQVIEAIAPLRGEPPPPQEAPPTVVVAEARRRVAAGQLDSAVQILAEHLRRDTGDLPAWRELGRVLDLAGRRDLANEAWGRVLSVEPLDPEALGAGGVDAATARSPLVAAERLLKLQQMVRVGEAPQPEPRQAIGQAVALGLSLREIGYLRAAAQCLEEGWRASQAWQGPDAEAIRRQGNDLMRIAGECALASGDGVRAAEAFRAALQAAPIEDRVALGRWVWAMGIAGQLDAAKTKVQEAMARPSAPGRAGLVLAMLALPEAARLPDPLPDPARTDPLSLRALVPSAPIAFAFSLLQRGTDRIHFGPALAFIAERMGTAHAIDQACARVAQDPWLAGELAAGLRSTAAAPSTIRAALQGRAEPSARLLWAHFELVGGDAQTAADAAQGVDAPGETGAALRTVEVLAAGALEDGAGVRRLAAAEVNDAPVAAALADAFVALGDRVQADRWAERAIDLDGDSPEAWMARARADLLAPSLPERPDGPPARLAEARLASERAWEAAPARSDTLRMLLQLFAPDAPQRSETVELVRAQPESDAALREIDRAEALRRVQSGQGEPAVDPLRALLTEDPLDAEVARSLVSASSAAGQLESLERFLQDLRVRRPGASAPLEALVTALAKRGRLDEGVALLRDASQAEPESLSRKLAWARALSIAARADEAWSVIDSIPRPERSPRLLLERAEFALRARREDAAVAALRQAAAGPLSAPQSLTALALALKLPAELPGRRAIAATLGRAALDAPEAGPLALAAAMLAGDDAEARQLALLRARPWSRRATLEAAQRLIDDAESDRATALLEAAAPLASPEDRAALVRAGLAALAATGQDAHALDWLLRERKASSRPVLLENPQADEASDINELAGLFLLAGNDEAAARLFEAAVARRPDMGEALNNLAWIRLVAARMDAATADLVARALAAGPDEPSTLDTAGWWSYLSGAPIADVIERLRRATSVPDPGIEPLDHLGDALWVAGRRDEATALWRSIVERGRGSASRAAAIQAFDRMQQRRTGLRAWNGASFYDARDGAAIARAQAKLQSIAEGREPPIAPRPPATPAPDPARVP